MPSYSLEFKEQIVRKMMPPHNQRVSTLSAELGISQGTLYRWKKEYRAKGFVVPSRKSIPDHWDAKTKLAAVIETAALNAEERSAYCRSNGLYVEQLDAWRELFESMDAPADPGAKAELARERKKIKVLEKELLRKDRALAETAALLALSKKAQAIWGIKEED
ncbi:transposase [Orrella sp. 11846]|uniref:transposase n=1 Tax=Orrella sp. 11846 TaxID=3409913 RepID=UPI003B5CCE79